MVDIINPFIVGAFVPPVIITDNQLFDFDADLGTTVADTDQLTAWEDQLVNVGDLITAAPRRPSLVANGNPAGDGNSILFDGVNDRMFVSGGFTWVQPATLYLVMKRITHTAADIIFDGEGSITALQEVNPTPNIQLNAGSAAAVNTGLILDTYSILCTVVNGASSSIRVNNNTKTTGDPGSADPGGLRLGSAFNNNNPSNIEVVRLLGYDTAAHDDSEQDQNISALNNIYSVF